MSVDTVNNGMIGDESAFGWEDVAIVVTEPTYQLTNPTHTESLSMPIQRGTLTCQSLEKNIFLSSGNSSRCTTDVSDEQIPASIRIGSSDDSYTSCSSESTDSASSDAASTSLNTTLSRNEPLLTEIITSTKTPQSGKAKKVVFTTVQIRDYDVTLGNHPYCEMYPLSLDWEYVESLNIPVDDYEDTYRRHVPKVTKVVSPIVFRKSNKRNSTVNIRARRLSVTDRMSLILEFTGLTSQQLFQQERRRQLLAHDEKLITACTSSAAEI